MDRHRDNWIEELNKTDALLQFSLMSGDEAGVERLRVKLRRLTGLDENRDCKPVWNGEN